MAAAQLGHVNPTGFSEEHTTDNRKTNEIAHPIQKPTPLVSVAGRNLCRVVNEGSIHKVPFEGHSVPVLLNGR